MSEVLIPIAVVIALIVGLPLFFFLEGRKVKKDQFRKRKNEENAKKAERNVEQFRKDRKKYLKENLSVPGVTKNPDLPKKFSIKKRFQKAPPDKKTSF